MPKTPPAKKPRPKLIGQPEFIEQLNAIEDAEPGTLTFFIQAIDKYPTGIAIRGSHGKHIGLITKTKAKNTLQLTAIPNTTANPYQIKSFRLRPPQEVTRPLAITQPHIRAATCSSIQQS